MKLRMLATPVSILLLAFGLHVRGDMNIVVPDYRSCICNEIQAYYAMNPSLTMDELVAKAKISCTGGDDAFCTPAEFDAIYNAVPDKTTYVWACAVSGTSLPGFP